ncbi:MULTISPECIES: phosphatase PAP2 family protein [Bizionia]|uniref:Phosphatase PAP2 family protein n=1 Tax=Bizionia algoritergicola TaxID=291187 RepID=A0A5D0QT34_9FLAO|nr:MULTISPECIES: phosphatase PAP2 family protein [Bizionia]OBX23204.1 phosphoesterase [Bizionia sp. APA-3]TYB71578.1 phosphatase PAP2 family protein [Bizionia algoritergicola]
MLEQLVQLDTELFLYLNNLGTTSWDGFWMFYTTKFYWIPFYAVLLFLIFRTRTPKLFLITIFVIFLMVLFTDQMTNVFKKVLVLRLRPCHDPTLEGLVRLVKSHCGGQFGFFSGHASNSMAVAVFSGLLLRFKYKYFIFLMLIWSAAMGYSRIYIGVHFPLDVICGMAFGAMSGFMFYKLDLYLQKRFGVR